MSDRFKPIGKRRLRETVESMLATLKERAALAPGDRDAQIGAAGGSAALVALAIRLGVMTDADIDRLGLDVAPPAPAPAIPQPAADAADNDIFLL